jgi:multiple sugar transport system permease protein
MNCTVALQTFLEPQVLGSATFGAVDPTWSPNELSYVFAFEQNNLSSAAAMSLILVVVTLTLSVIAVKKTGLLSSK